tara:strand:- start:2263 stop:2514 length:252 start_codon:yes stop_codon:yes gene_type:complete
MNKLLKKKHIVLDTSGTECPIPVLKARKLSQTLKDGDLVKVIATDPLAEGDFIHYCEESKFEYLGTTKNKDGIHILYKYKKTN